MALGSSDKQRRFDDPVAVLGDRLKDGSIYKLLAEHGHEMFPDDYFADPETDEPLLHMASRDAELLLQKDPRLTGERGRAVRLLLRLFDRMAAFRTLHSG